MFTFQSLQRLRENIDLVRYHQETTLDSDLFFAWGEYYIFQVIFLFFCLRNFPYSSYFFVPRMWSARSYFLCPLLLFVLDLAFCAPRHIKSGGLQRQTSSGKLSKKLIPNSNREGEIEMCKFFGACKGEIFLGCAFF